jgi:protein SCO1
MPNPARHIKVISRSIGLMLLGLSIGSAFAQPQFTQPLTFNGALPPGDLPDRVSIDQRLNEKIPLDLRFIDDKGQSVELAKYFSDKPVILTLAYYECPMLCTQVINGVVRSLRPLSLSVGQDYEIITVSIDPGEKFELAAQKKREYIQTYKFDGADEAWHFLTGDEESIRQLAEAVGFRYVFDEATDQYIHASGMMMLTPDGVLSRYFYGIDFAPRNVKLGLIEAADGKIGSPIDHLLLLCYQYDPRTGQYGLIIFNSLRVAGVVTVLALGTFVVAMVRRDRQKTATPNTEV